MPRKRQKQIETPASEPTSPPESSPVESSRPEILGQHTAAVISRRPHMQTPDGYKDVVWYPSVGIRVNKGIEHYNSGRVALQFSNERPLCRETEYDLMTAVQEAGFQFHPGRRQWERALPEGWPIGENVIDAVRLARELAIIRGAGIER